MAEPGRVSEEARIRLIGGPRNRPHPRMQKSAQALLSLNNAECYPLHYFYVL